MKVSFIYRILFFFAVGFASGAGLGGYMTTRVILKNMPPTQEIEIGRLKLKGQGNELDLNIKDAKVEQVENKKNRIRRRK